MPTFDTREFDSKLAYLRANLRLDPVFAAERGIELTESGLIRHDKSIGQLIGVDAPTLTRIRNGEVRIAAGPAAAFLKLFGLRVPDALDANDPAHALYVRLLVLPLASMLVEMRSMDADIPSATPLPGEPWRRLLRRAHDPHPGHRGYVALHHIDRAPDLPLGPMRGLPPGVPNPVRPLGDLPSVHVGERVSYLIGLDGFDAGEDNAVHLWAVLSGSSAEGGEPLHVPLLPAPGWREDYTGPTRRKWSLALEIPERPSQQRCLVIPAHWGLTREVVVVVTSRPLDEDILQACRDNDRLAPELLDLAATRLMDEQRWKASAWMVLRQRHNVVGSSIP